MLSLLCIHVVKCVGTLHGLIKSVCDNQSSIKVSVNVLWEDRFIHKEAFSSMMFSSALTDKLSCLFIGRLRRRMWKNHSAIPQKRLGGNGLSSGGGDGEWKINLNCGWTIWPKIVCLSIFAVTVLHHGAKMKRILYQFMILAFFSILALRCNLSCKKKKCHLGCFFCLFCVNQTTFSLFWGCKWRQKLSKTPLIYYINRWF